MTKILYLQRYRSPLLLLLLPPLTTTTTTTTNAPPHHAAYSSPSSQEGPQMPHEADKAPFMSPTQNPPLKQPSTHHKTPSSLTNKEESWFGAPVIPTGLETQRFRQEIRRGLYTQPTNGKCPGYLQCNLVVLPQGPEAFDFLLFCQRNKKACPLIEVCYGHPHPNGVARQADLRTDVPKYAIYENGKLIAEVTDATDYWPDNAVSFLIGCSFTYDGALLKAGIPLRSAEQGKNVPMYNTNLPCRSAGSLSGNMVVSMKPISALHIAKEVEVTSRFPHAHGGPVCVGRPEAIGVADIHKPDWGDAVEFDPLCNEIPVFHACGVTPQSVLMKSRVPYAITHSAGHMFITDLPSDTSFE
mmetsp:Transcript_13646/g.19669  ORF Transcript_13646/g.19669 Transcript_13646/m.19669 type:complete len:356 (-) Transcript_13646:391-1458(-)